MYRAIRPSTTKYFTRLGARSFQTFGPRLVNVGDSIPAVQVFENSPSGVVDLAKETEKVCKPHTHLIVKSMTDFGGGW